MCASRERKGLQKSAMFATMIGLVWRVSRRPGELLDQFLQSADAAGERDNPSDRSNISFFRACISSTTISSSTSRSICSFSLRNAGIIPVT